MRFQGIPAAYRRHRADGMGALNAYRYALSQAADARLERALDEGEFEPEHGRETWQKYQLDNGGALRVEIEWVSDSMRRDWPDEPETLDALYKHFRSEKYGRRAAREAAAKTQQAQRDYKAADYQIDGVAVRLLWRGVEVASESLWGCEHADSDYLLSVTRELLSQARYTARGAIRAKGREVRALAGEFGFAPLAGYSPAEARA